jgi:methionine synthase / methylenetetrahydrofolate reductase(NADPH)
MSRFLERLTTSTPIVADGGTGALLSGAVPRLRCPEEANLRAPDTVQSVHLGFIRAGAELITTNTFGANRRKLWHHFLDDQFEAINTAGAKLARDARDASGRSVLIAGSIGPLGELGEFEYGDLTADFAEQATILEARGVDLFLLETFFDLDELVTAVEAVRSVSSLPVVAMMTFDEEGTPAGVTAREAGERLAALKVDAMGANCGTGPQAALIALAQMGGHGIPLAAKPNIGEAGRVGGRISYPQGTPDYFGDFAAHARVLGAGVIGGCCGTTAAQVGAIAAALEEGRTPAEPIGLTARALQVTPSLPTGKTRLQEAFERGDWVVSLELDPPTGANPEAMLDFARRARATGGVGFVDVNDTTKNRARINSFLASIAIEQSTGIETIPHLTPRDMSVTGIESMLLGAHAAGIRNVLAITGDPPTAAGYASSAGVYEVDALGLCRIVSQLNSGEDWNGRPIDGPTSFYLGVAVNPTADDLDLELDRFHQKVEAGARFAMTQALFDLDPLDRFVERLGGTWPIPVLLGVFHVTSHRMALHLHNEVPGIVVPDPVLDLLESAGADAPACGLDLARRLIDGSRGRVAGVYVIPPFRQPETTLALFTDS